MKEAQDGVAKATINSGAGHQVSLACGLACDECRWEKDSWGSFSLPHPPPSGSFCRRSIDTVSTTAKETKWGIELTRLYGGYDRGSNNNNNND